MRLRTRKRNKEKCSNHLAEQCLSCVMPNTVESSKLKRNCHTYTYKMQWWSGLSTIKLCSKRLRGITEFWTHIELYASAQLTKTVLYYKDLQTTKKIWSPRQATKNSAMMFIYRSSIQQSPKNMRFMNFSVRRFQCIYINVMKLIMYKNYAIKFRNRKLYTQ
jgi:hypothetical protein